LCGVSFVDVFDVILFEKIKISQGSLLEITQKVKNERKKNKNRK
jgi:hypothetical protein